jgi:hypothetical protein
MKNQLATAAFLILSFCATISMKEPARAGASQQIIVAGGGCPVPSIPVATSK